jgi:hypothetical protein
MAELTDIHPALIDSHHFYGSGSPMTREEINAAAMLKPISKPLGLYNWRTTDGEEFGKGYTAILVQVGINERAAASLATEGGV